MRLSLFEIEAIIKIKNELFTESTKIYLFGSRVDDDQKGGDIDLFIDEEDIENKFEKKIAFISRLNAVIGEQKIDLVFAADKDRVIEKEAREKGVELSLEKIKLQKYFNECDKHLQRIEEAYADMQSFIPLSVEKYHNLTKDEVQAIDQYLYRFAKLQDTMGDKIFKLIIQQYEQNSDILPFLDILNKLEKIGFITSAKEWINLRKIRNEISHQYDDEPEEMSQAINKIVSQKVIIEENYLKLKHKYEEVRKKS